MSNVSLTSKKPRLGFWQIWNMSFGFLGIQFGFALQNANTSRIFETLGADAKNLAIYWLAAPVTGLLIQPIIGYYSDRTWHPKWGRRRPFFAVGAILATVALCIMPNSPSLWVAIGMLWIMDGSINISMEPFRAFVGDMLPNEQRTRGFAMQSFFIGVGAVVASVLPWVLVNWLGIPDTNPEGGIPPNVRLSFYLGGAVFLTAVMWTVFTTREYPPAPGDLEKVRQKKPLHELVIRYTPSQYMQRGVAMILAGVALVGWFYFKKLDPQLYVVAGILLLFGLSYFSSALLMRQGKYQSGFVQIVRDFQNMPRTMVQLAFVQFFSWFALFAMWIYTTNGMTSHMYDLKLDETHVRQMVTDVKGLNFSTPLVYKNGKVIEDAYTGTQTAGMLKKKRQEIQKELNNYRSRLDAGDPYVVTNMGLINFFLDKNVQPQLSASVLDRVLYVQEEYNQGGNWVGILFGVYNGMPMLIAFLLPVIAGRISRRITHMIMLLFGAAGFLSFYIIKDPNLLILSMVGIGFAWTSILSIPYAMLSASLPAKKMGYYMGIFNFFIVIPQMVAASILGFLVVTFFDGQFIFALVIGGFSMLLAALLCLRVEDHEEVHVKEDHA